MFAFAVAIGGKADMAFCAACPLLTQSGHSCGAEKTMQKVWCQARSTMLSLTVFSSADLSLK